ncbi:MAG: TfoX/Sxy family protein [Flavipsychrobacter sp.]|nr:TfoX/Sxy family protein [Flavipsychrobacter sp.]
MAYNEQLNDRLREALAHLDNVEEKHMFGGTCYMVNGKMCIGVMKDELMCRIGPDRYEEAMEKRGCHEMAFAGKVMKGYVLVSEDGIRSTKDFRYWINACLEFNVIAKAAKKKKTK